MERNEQQKVMVSGRIPSYVKKYCEKNDIAISRLLMAGFDHFRANDIDHALNRLRLHEERVIHWKQKVIHREQECNTKHQVCNTIKKVFDEQGRGQDKRMDLNWLEPKVTKLQKDGIPINLEELYDFCKKKQNVSIL